VRVVVLFQFFFVRLIRMILMRPRSCLGEGVRCHVAGVLAINARRISFESKLYCSVSQKSELFLFVARN
jgi:hypothetical protein